MSTMLCFDTLQPLVPIERPSGVLRVACLQLEPVYGDVQKSMEKANVLLRARADCLKGLQLLVLPEMAFTGYQFPDAEHITPLLENGDGPIMAWCRRTAIRLGCTVCCGCARLSEGRRLNSMVIVGQDGEFAGAYDKHFLYDTDKAWAEAGPAFRSASLPGVPVARVGLGICSDIQPFEFIDPRLFEFANFHRYMGSQIIVFSSSWCTNHPQDPASAFVNKSEQTLRQETLQEWIERLAPLIGHDVHFICADRVGSEDMALIGGAPGQVNKFCGCSCVLSMKRPSVLGLLDSTAEGVLVVDVPMPEGGPLNL